MAASIMLSVHHEADAALFAVVTLRMTASFTGRFKGHGPSPGRDVAGVRIHKCPALARAANAVLSDTSPHDFVVVMRQAAFAVIAIVVPAPATRG